MQICHVEIILLLIGVILFTKVSLTESNGNTKNVFYLSLSDTVEISDMKKSKCANSLNCINVDVLLRN